MHCTGFSVTLTPGEEETGQKVYTRRLSIESVKEYLKQYGKDGDVIEFPVSSATVKEAAADLGTEEGRIAKSMSFMTAGGPMIIVLAGDGRIDNRKFKDAFHEKARMISADEVEDVTGHPVGGVCPFAVKEGVKVYIDVSVRRFSTVFPAAGTPNSAIELTPEELFSISGAQGWVDIAKI